MVTCFPMATSETENVGFENFEPEQHRGACHPRAISKAAHSKNFTGYGEMRLAKLQLQGHWSYLKVVTDVAATTVRNLR
jgi:hypothetical protein